MDQATTLRNAVGGKDARFTRVLAVSSGKGGVGKTNSVVNLAVALTRMGKKVMLLDADLGLGNLDILLGIAPKYNMGHLLRGEKTIEEVIMRGPAGIMILPATSGVQELTELGPEERLALSSHLESMDLGVDVLIIDTGAGISSNVLFFNVVAQDIIVIVSPEPTSITDAYALMKVLNKKHGEMSFKLIVNMARSKKDGLEVYRKISLAAERFLGVSVDYLGAVLYDDNVPKSVIQQTPVTQLYPDSKASICYEEIAREINELPVRSELKGGMQFFWSQMLNRTV